MKKVILEIGRLLGLDLKARRKNIAGHGELIWFESGEIDSVLFQVNTSPKTAGCVFYLSEGIISGWHSIETKTNAQLEIARLDPIFGKHWFATKEKTSVYKKLNPDFCGITVESLKDRPVFHD